MRKLSKLAAGSVIATATAIGGAGLALADGYNAPRVRYERPSDWSGVYFGVQSGYQWSSIDTNFVNAGTNFSVDQNSGLVGAFLGYQHQFGQIVLGVEGNWLSAFRDEVGSATCPGATFTCTQRLNDILTAGGRVGWAAGHWMPYVTGGFASARYEYRTFTTATGTVFDTGATRHDGWYIGGGAEWKVSPGWAVGLEYRHYEFDTAGQQPNKPDGTFTTTDKYSADPTTDTITARVSWRWGREPAAPLK